MNEQISTEKNFSLTAAKGAKDALSVLDRLSKKFGTMSDREIETAKQSMAAVVYNDILQHDASKRELARKIAGDPEMYKTTLEKTKMHNKMYIRIFFNSHIDFQNVNDI